MSRQQKKIIRDKIKDIHGRSPYIYIATQATAYEDKVVKKKRVVVEFIWTSS
jgi:hypothetical protein